MVESLVKIVVAGDEILGLPGIFIEPEDILVNWMDPPFFIL